MQKKESVCAIQCIDAKYAGVGGKLPATGCGFGFVFCLFVFFLSEIQLELKSGACMASCWHVSECLVDSRVRLWLCMHVSCVLAVL